jgi:pilus assembly protein CpaB
MQRRVVLVIVLAVVMGLLASLLVYRVTTRATGPVEEHERVVVASANIAMAEAVKREQVKLVDWPKRSVPAGALRKLAEAEGRIVRNSIVAGEPLLEAKLAPAGKGGILPILVPASLRGVTIKVDDAVKESGFILPGSRVDILVSMPRSPGSQERFAKVILQDVQVLAAGQTVEMRDNKPVTVTNVTLALTPGQTERLALAQVEGRLTLAMRGLGDNQLVHTTGVSAAILLGGDAPAAPPAAGSPKPRAPVPVSAAVPRPARNEDYTITIWRGKEAEQATFVRGEDQAEWVARPTRK